MNNRVPLLFALPLSIAGFTSVAGAADIGFLPRLEVGLLDYSFESEGFSTTIPATTAVGNRTFSQSDFEYSDTMFFVGGGLTFFADRFFVDLSAQKSFDGNDNDNAPFSLSTNEASLQLNGGTTFANIRSDPSFSTDFDRVDYAISFGYAVTERFSVFAGYKYAKTEFDADVGGPFSFALGDDLLPGLTDQAPLTAGSDLLEGRSSGKASYDFEYDGPFIGATYGWQLDGDGFFKGLLSANMAVAFLDGEVDVDDSSVDVNFTSVDGVDVPGGIDVPESFLASNLLPSEGDTLGVTFGLNWRGFTPVDGLTYSLGFSAHQYSFDADNSGQPDIKETAITYKAGVAYSF